MIESNHALAGRDAACSTLDAVFVLPDLDFILILTPRAEAEQPETIVVAAPPSSSAGHGKLEMIG